MSRKVFFDTNVVLDILFEREPFIEAAQLLMSRILRTGERPLISSVSVVNISYSAYEIHGKAKTRKGIGQLLDKFTITSVDSEIVHAAHLANWKDFEDAIQYFSAMAARTDVIVTRDVKGYEERKIPILTPAQALVMLKNL